MHLNPAHQRMKSCVRYLCRASVRLQISSLSFTLCWTVLNALFMRIVIVQRILSNRQPPYWIVWFSICCVVVGRRSHCYASFLRLADEEIILRQYSRNLFLLYYSLATFREVFFVSEGHRKPETYCANLGDQHKFCAARSVLLRTEWTVTVSWFNCEKQ